MRIYSLVLMLLGLLLIVGCSTAVQQGTEKAQIDEVGAAEETIDIQEDDGPNIVIDGGGNKYLPFNQAAYDKSVSEGKVVLLDFYANWCPICRSENPHIIDGINSINNPNVIGYQVHILDDEATGDGDALAKKFGVYIQHTKVVVKNGELFSKSLESWDKAQTIKKINEAL